MNSKFELSSSPLGHIFLEVACLQKIELLLLDMKGIQLYEAVLKLQIADLVMRRYFILFWVVKVQNKSSLVGLDSYYVGNAFSTHKYFTDKRNIVLLNKEV